MKSKKYSILLTLIGSILLLIAGLSSGLVGPVLTLLVIQLALVGLPIALVITLFPLLKIPATKSGKENPTQ
jgi:hypothetical protein